MPTFSNASKTKGLSQKCAIFGDFCDFWQHRNFGNVKRNISTCPAQRKNDCSRQAQSFHVNKMSYANVQEEPAKKNPPPTWYISLSGYFWTAFWKRALNLSISHYLGALLILSVWFKLKVERTYVAWVKTICFITECSKLVISQRSGTKKLKTEFWALLSSNIDKNRHTASF